MEDAENALVFWSLNIELEREDFSFEAAKTLSLIFDRPDFSDVTLVCEDQKQIFAHKVILASASSFFRNIFSFHEKHLVYLRIKFSDLKAIMSFIYTGQCQVVEERLQELLEISTGLEILGLANNEEIKVNRVSNDDDVEPFEDEATLLSDETSIIENIGSNDNHSEQSEFQEEALLSGGSEKVKTESKTTTKGFKTQDEVILKEEALPCADEVKQETNNKTTETESLEEKAETKNIQVKNVSHCNDWKSTCLSHHQLKKHRREAHMAEKSSPSVKTLSSQHRNDQNTNDADNILEIEERLTFFENDTKRKAHDKNFHTFV